MRIVNNHRAPEAFINFCKDDKYSKGDADISVTQLIEVPRIVAFSQRYPELIVQDPSENPWLFIGQIMHGVLEDYAPDDQTSEQRIHTTVDGVKISGSMDVQIHDYGDNEEIVDIGDYKFTSVYSLKDTTKWEQQLNLYAFLVEDSRPFATVNSLKIYAFLRDWRIGQSEVIKGYPATPGITIDIPLWDPRERELFAKGQVALHRAVKLLPDDDLPECSHEARWPTGTAWELLTEGEGDGYQVLSTHKTKTLAKAAMDKLDPVVEMTSTIRKTHALYRRCKSYCDFKSVCNQYQEKEDEQH